MGEDISNENAIWPMPRFKFLVDLGTDLKDISFQDVSGMDVESQIIEYRKSNTNLVSEEKLPGIGKYGDVTMKSGVFTNNNTFKEWYKQVSNNTVKRSTVVVKLLDSNGDVTMQWQLKNAWPKKITSNNLNPEGSEVTIDTIEILHEELTIINGK